MEEIEQTDVFLHLTELQKDIVRYSVKSMKLTNNVVSAKLGCRDSNDVMKPVQINLSRLARSHPNFMYNPHSFAAGNMRIAPRATESVYKRGKLICMGLPDTIECLNNVYTTIKILQTMKVPCELKEFAVHNFVFSAFMGYSIDLQRLFADSAKYNGFVTYDSAIFTAASIKCNRMPGYIGDITVLIFDTSKANITGGQNEYEALYCWRKLVTEVLIHYIILDIPAIKKGRGKKRQQPADTKLDLPTVVRETVHWKDDDEDGDNDQEDYDASGVQSGEQQEDDDDKYQGIDFDERNSDDEDADAGSFDAAHGSSGHQHGANAGALHQNEQQNPQGGQQACGKRKYPQSPKKMHRVGQGTFTKVKSLENKR